VTLAAEIRSAPIGHHLSFAGVFRDRGCGLGDG